MPGILLLRKLFLKLFSMATVIKNGIVVDTEPETAVLGQLDVRVEDGRISEVRAGIDEPGAEVIDATGMIVLPGFVDTHRHTWQAGLRAYGVDMLFRDYLREVVQGAVPRLRPQDLYLGTLAGALECLDGGTTTLMDWSLQASTPEHARETARALHESGIRAVLGYSGPNGDGYADAAREAYEQLPGGTVTMAIAAQGPEFAGEERSRAEWAIARELGLRVTVHLGGGDPESGERALRFLHDEGLLAVPTLIVHANSFGDEAFKLIAANGGAVSVTPIDELTLGIGHPVTGRARAAGAPAGLGADAVICTSGDMFSLMRAAHMLERNRPDGAGHGFSAKDALRMATIEGAEALGLGDDVGSLRPGKLADLVLIRTTTPGMAGTHDPIGAVVMHAGVADVDTVLVGGRVVKRGGALIGHDVPELAGRLRESAAAVLA